MKIFLPLMGFAFFLGCSSETSYTRSEETHTQEEPQKSSGARPSGNNPKVDGKDYEDATLELSWNPNANPVDSFKVYGGKKGLENLEEVFEFSVSQDGFTLTAPQISIPVMDSEVKNLVGSEACFQIKAISSVGESTLSERTCLKI